MVFNKKSWTRWFILMFILMVIYFLYKLYLEKENKQNEKSTFEMIQKYLLNDNYGLDGLGLSGNGKDNDKRPIMWLHIPYEYNSRQWNSFSSRSSTDLNQPYLYLTVKSIIDSCGGSFRLCIIDDSCFHKLITKWDIKMDLLSNPILEKIRQYGLINLVNIYGGIVCPISFLCMKNMADIYETHCLNDNKILITEHTQYDNGFPLFFGASRKNPLLKTLLEEMQHTISTDMTADSIFTNKWSNWLIKQSKNNIFILTKMQLGIETIDKQPILIEHLLGNNYLNLFNELIGIYIPMTEILKRSSFGWFSRMSSKQILQSNTIIGNYLLLSQTPEYREGILEPLKNRPKWVGFWKTPLYTNWGLKPNLLGNNVLKEKYPCSLH